MGRRVRYGGWCAIGVGLLFAHAGAAEPPDQSTPYSTVEGFGEAARRGDYDEAAQYLSLRHVPQDRRAAEGPRLAHRLRFVLDQLLPVDLSAVSREEAGDPAEPRFDVIGHFDFDRRRYPVRLERLPGTPARWVFAEDTVRAADRIYEAQRPPWVDRLPNAMVGRTFFTLEPWQWLGLAILLVGGTGVALLLARLLARALVRMAKLTAATWDDQLAQVARRPLYLPLWAAVIAVGTRTLVIPTGIQRGFDLLCRILVIVAVSWLLLRALTIAVEQMEAKLTSAGPDGHRVRRVRTQIAVLRRVCEVGIYVIGAALVLVQFELVRTVGVSLLASAGIAGLVLGLAAQRSIGSLLAGLQLSLTQPIRIGDNLLVEGEYGTVEEIHLTYAVLRTWDLRRLVVPITYFLERPFQNWSRGSPELLGQVVLHLDFRADVDALRAELTRLLEHEARPLWDGKVQGVQVTETTDRVQVVRVLVSARDPSQAFDLRCLLRERLLTFARSRTDWLPTTRSETLSRSG